MSITVQNLTHIYSENSPYQRAAIDDVSFTINNGDFVGLIGHTGSGKSTLIEHLNGLLKPNSGHIFIDNEDITLPKCNLKNIRAKVGLVFQYPEYQLFEETVYDDIAYGPRNLNLSEEEVKNRVFEAMGFVGLNTNLLKASPFELSGGQKRRVAIAGVIAMQPDTLILDEPTAGLDPAAKNDLLKRLKELHAAKNNTIILVSHSMEDIASTVDKVMVMANGKLVCYDTVFEVFKKSDLLKSVGLDVPQISEVISFFKSLGFEMHDIYTVEQAADAIYNIIKGEKNAERYYFGPIFSH